MTSLTAQHTVPAVFTMNIETVEGITQHPYHLGTDRAVALTFVHEKLRRAGVMSVALLFGGKREKIYDWRDLPEHADAGE